MSFISLRTRMELKNQEETIKNYQKELKEKNREITELKALDKERLELLIKKGELIAELKAEILLLRANVPDDVERDIDIIIKESKETEKGQKGGNER